MKVSKDTFLEEISKLEKLLPLEYKDYFNYDSAFYIENYPITVLYKVINFDSFFSYYYNGNRYLAVRDDWLKSISLNYQEKVWAGQKVVYYIERLYKPSKVSNYAIDLFWKHHAKFLILLTPKCGRIYVGRSYLINQILRRLHERQERVSK